MVEDTMDRLPDVHISAAVQRIGLSASNRASDLVRAARARGQDIINLTVGEPDFDTPEHIQEAAIRAIREGQTRYTSIHGTAALKEAVIAKFERDYGLRFGADSIAVSAGAKQIIYNALVASLDPGDEVIVPAPYYISYPHMVRLIGGTVREVAADEGDALPLERIEAAIGARTRWIIVNSPNNPTGAVYDRAQLSALAGILRRHPGVMVLSDDVYEHTVFDGRAFASLAQVAPDLCDRILTVNSTSKAYSMTGWRLGFAAGPAALVARMASVQSQSTAAPCSISQAAAVAALTGPQALLAERRRIFEQRRDLLLPLLERIEGIVPNRPGGAFFVMLDCAALFGRCPPGGAPLRDGSDVARYFLEAAQIATIAGAAYGAPSHLRLSFATTTDDLRRAAERIEQVCGALQ